MSFKCYSTQKHPSQDHKLQLGTLVEFSNGARMFITEYGEFRGNALYGVGRIKCATDCVGISHNDVKVIAPPKQA